MAFADKIDCVKAAASGKRTEAYIFNASRKLNPLQVGARPKGSIL